MQTSEKGNKSTVARSLRKGSQINDNTVFALMCAGVWENFKFISIFKCLSDVDEACWTRCWRWRWKSGKQMWIAWQKSKFYHRILLCIGIPCFMLLSSINTTAYNHTVAWRYIFLIWLISWVEWSQLCCACKISVERISHFFHRRHFLVTQKRILWNLANINNKFLSIDARTSTV